MCFSYLQEGFEVDPEHPPVVFFISQGPQLDVEGAHGSSKQQSIILQQLLKLNTLQIIPANKTNFFINKFLLSD